MKNIGLLALILMLCSCVTISPSYARKRVNRYTKVMNASKARSRFNRLYDKKLKRVRYFKDGVIVKFKKGTSKPVMKKYMLRNHLKPVAKLSNRTYSCTFLGATGDEAVEPVVRLLTTMGLPEYVELDIEEEDAVEDVDIDEYRLLSTHARRRRRQRRAKKVNFLKEQWHIENDGDNGIRQGADINVKKAWEITKGNGVRVAVIDTGFDLDHPDINYFGPGYDAVADEVGAEAPSRSNENHGTAVAGVVAAKDNQYGVIGVAPDATIIPIRLIPDDGFVSVSNIVLAHKKAAELGAHIINNSWGSYDPSLPEGEQLTISSLEKELYEDLATNGNDGKGILVIFASGNSGEETFDNSPEAREPSTLAVGATDSSDERSGYSVYGPELDIVAPGGGTKGIVTTDRSDLKIRKQRGKSRTFVMGYSKGAITANFKGTSAAAPVVAGVAALVRAVNPKLTVAEVRDILARSAEKDLGVSYDFDPVTGKSAEVGHGRVDAGAAVNMAISR